jgi:hypothetical protein
MSISEISLYKALRLKLGEDTASELVEFVKTEVKTELDNNTNRFLTKEDKIDLIEKINGVNNSLSEKMNKDKIDLIKWMFGFWFTIVLLLLANWFLK